MVPADAIRIYIFAKQNNIPPTTFWRIMKYSVVSSFVVIIETPYVISPYLPDGSVYWMLDTAGIREGRFYRITTELPYWKGEWEGEDGHIAGFQEKCN